MVIHKYVGLYARMKSRMCITLRISNLQKKGSISTILRASITFPSPVSPYSCGACVSRAFSRAKHFSCPVCQATIKRSGLSEKSPEELAFARDVHWTKYVNEMYGHE